MTKKEMFNMMQDTGFEEDLTEDSSYEDIKKAFQEMLKERRDECDAMYPNGRDYDAEDEDGL